MKKRIKTKTIILASTIFMILMNVVFNAFKLNGYTTKEISDMYMNLFTPAPITFSIWFVIYILLGLYVYAMFHVLTDNEKYIERYDRIGVLFSVSNIANGFWMVAWHYNVIWLSLILMFILFGCLAAIFIEIKKMDYQDFILKAAFGTYFGWITIAMIANITVFLTSISWNGFGISQEIWTIIILVVGLIITSITAYVNDNFFYMLVTIWAYLGIFMNHTSPLGWANQYPLVVMTTGACIVIEIVVLLLVMKGYFKHYKEKVSVMKG